MDKIFPYFDSIGLDLTKLLWAVGLVLVGSIAISLLGRIFGKKSSLTIATSSAIGILFVYALNLALQCAGLKFQSLTAPLPFLRLDHNNL